MRYALYMTPPPGSPLAAFGAATLGYDAHSGTDNPHLSWPDVPADDFARVTEDPRRYGFHATLKAPIRLAAGLGEDEFLAEAERFGRDRPPVPVGRLAVAEIGRFIALIPADPPPGLGLFAAECVAWFDRFRAPMDEVERRRRESTGLSPLQARLLARWGYPYVFDTFRFHMTLTGPLPDEVRVAWRARLVEAFSPLAEDAVVIDALTVLRQDGPDARFRVIARFPLTGASGP